jgi:hypothetical protein
MISIGADEPERSVWTIREQTKAAGVDATTRRRIGVGKAGHIEPIAFSNSLLISKLSTYEKSLIRGEAHVG